MRILLIHQAFVSPDDAGGTRHYEFARHALKSGHDFSIVASDLSYLTGRRTPGTSGLVTRQELEGISIFRAYTYPSLHKSFRWRIASFLSFMCTSVIAGLRAGPIDIVFGTSPPIFQSVSAWIVALLRRRPFLLEIRDLWPDFAIEMGVLKNRHLVRLSRWLESFLYNRAAHIIVNSPAYRGYLEKRGIPTEKITLIPNGVDPAMFCTEVSPKAFRDRFGLNGQFLVVYAGALGMANDLQTLLKAAAQLKDELGIHFLIVGDGKESANLKAIASELKLNNVSFLGAFPKSEMPQVLGASDACVATLLDIPMFRTTYPNKVFDYMAAGKPTILGIDGVIRKVIEDARGGIPVKPGDPQELADAIMRLYRNPTEATKMGRAARDYVGRHFNRKVHAEEFLELCQKIKSK